MPALIVLALSVFSTELLSASVPRWCVVYLMATVAVLWWCYRGRLDPVDWAALALFGYTALSLLWSGDWRQGIHQLTNASALLCVFVWVRHSGSRYLPESALCALLVAWGLHLYYPDGYGGHGNRNFQTEVMLVCLALGYASESRAGKIAFRIMCPVTLGYLMVFNASKIEFLVLLALAVTWFGSRRLSARSRSRWSS